MMDRFAVSSCKILFFCLLACLLSLATLPVGQRLERSARLGRDAGDAGAPRPLLYLRRQGLCLAAPEALPGGRLTHIARDEPWKTSHSRPAPFDSSRFVSTRFCRAPRLNRRGAKRRPVTSLTSASCFHAPNVWCKSRVNKSSSSRFSLSATRNESRDVKKFSIRRFIVNGDSNTLKSTTYGMFGLCF